MKKLLITLLLLAINLVIHAQKKINAQETFGEGYENLLSNDFPEALFAFEQLVQYGYGNANISYFSGICYLNMPGREKKAISNFEAAIRDININYSEGSFSETSAPLQSYYFLAQSYRISGDFSKASQMLLTLEDLIDTVKDKSTLALIKHELGYGNNALVLMKQPVSLKKTNAGEYINSTMDELNPAITPNDSTLFFVSRKKFYDAIFMDNKIDDEWAEKEEITNKLGSDGEYRVLSVSPDGKRILLYAYDMYTAGDIYESRLAGIKWSKCKKLGKNINSPYSENFASFSPDSKTMYFTSNRPGGYGGHDLYRSVVGSDGEWSEAISLGQGINTEYDEATPLCSPDGNYLFFSSKGHFSMGGFDIFRAKIAGDKLSYPRNIGYPLNTPSDNLNWTPLGNGLTAYLPAIYPEGLGGFDIWKIKTTSPPDLPRFTLSGTFELKGNSDSIIPQFSICLEAKQSDSTECLQLKAGSGEFTYKRPAGLYKLSAEATGYKSQVMDISLDAEQSESVIFLDVQLEKNIKVQPKRSIDLHDILFSFNSVSLRPEYYGMLDSIADLLHDLPELQLIISGFADGKGKKDYNLTLSLKRAQAIFRYLSDKNTNKTRMQCLGKGSTEPVAIEKSKDGRDLPEGRYWNRRVELNFSLNDRLDVKRIAPPVHARLRIDKQFIFD